MGASIGSGVGFPFGPSVFARYEPVGGLVNQGISAEMIADKWDLSREDLDAFAAESQQRAATATAEARFDRELVPVADQGRRRQRDRRDPRVGRGHPARARRPRRSATLKPAFKPDGKITAGNSSQITDGASAVLVMSEEKAAALGLRPRARFVEFAVVGVDPVTMLTGPIPATTKVLDRAGMKLDDIDLVEINEAFASVVLAWEKEHHPDMSRVNVNGGAIALGHPLGASGAKLMATLALRARAHRRPLRPRRRCARAAGSPTPRSSSASADRCGSRCPAGATVPSAGRWRCERPASVVLGGHHRPDHDPDQAADEIPVARAAGKDADVVADDQEQADDEQDEQHRPEPAAGSAGRFSGSAPCSAC